MPIVSESAGGTSGAHPKDGPSKIFRYTEDEWRAIAAVVPGAKSGLRFWLERSASEFLNQPNAHDLRVDLLKTATSCRRINEAAAVILEEIGESSADRRFIRDLEILLAWSEKMEDVCRADVPHGNRVVGWESYLDELCRSAESDAGLKLTQKRRFDGQAYGPAIDFLIAAANPVRSVSASKGVFGEMTPEIAHRALRRYIKDWGHPTNWTGCH